jgi:hypothetical protein
MSEVNYEKCPEYLEGRAARAAEKPKSACPYDDTLGQRYLWESGWEAEKAEDGSRNWCDHCRKPLYDATYCGNCGRPASQ